MTWLAGTLPAGRTFFSIEFAATLETHTMADTVALTDHEAIRDWAAARSGFPAVIDTSAESGTQPLLRIVFDQQAYQDTDRAERPQNAGGYELVEWDDWFALFDTQKLALLVAVDRPGVRESSHRIVKR